MIVVSNRVEIPEDRVDTFEARLRTSHGVDEQPGFEGLKLLAPVDGDEHVTMTFWDSIEDYEAWREGRSSDRAHEGTSADEAFAAPNHLETHEVAVERPPDGPADSESDDL